MRDSAGFDSVFSGLLFSGCIYILYTGHTLGGKKCIKSVLGLACHPVADHCTRVQLEGSKVVGSAMVLFKVGLFIKMHGGQEALFFCYACAAVDRPATTLDFIHVPLAKEVFLWLNG